MKKKVVTKKKYPTDGWVRSDVLKNTFGLTDLYVESYVINGYAELSISNQSSGVRLGCLISEGTKRNYINQLTQLAAHIDDLISEVENIK